MLTLFFVGYASAATQLEVQLARKRLAQFERHMAMPGMPDVSCVHFTVNGYAYTVQERGPTLVSRGGLDVWRVVTNANGVEMTESFTDEDLDGIVDFGNNNNGDLFVAYPGTLIGEQHRARWQAAYDEAIADLRGPIHLVPHD